MTEQGRVHCNKLSAGRLACYKILNVLVESNKNPLEMKAMFKFYWMLKHRKKLVVRFVTLTNCSGARGCKQPLQFSDILGYSCSLMLA